MLFDLIRSGFSTQMLISVLLSLPVILFSLAFHETAHGYVAYKLGDPTAHNMGRLTLNPIKHIDPIGFLCMLTFGFGWAKPVPVNARYFKNPRKGMAITGIAGPLSNLFLALVFYLLLTISTGIFASSGLLILENGMIYYLDSAGSYIALAIYLLFSVAVQLNLALAVFNMIPVPPFDGSRFIYILLPAKWYFKVMKYERYTGLVIMLLIFGLSRIGIYPVSWVTGVILKGLDFLIGNPILRLFGF